MSRVSADSMLFNEFEDEFEDEFEGELSGEFEDELSVGGSGELEDELSQLEAELENPELSAHEFEHAMLHESEAEDEAEQFFGGLAKLAARAVRSPALRRLAGSVASSALKSLTGDGEMEDEFEGESEFELNPIRRVYPDAMMEHLAHEAAEAQSEQEAAEAFLPLIPLLGAKLLPLAAKALPIAAKLGAKVATKVGPKLLNSFMRSAPQMHRAVRGMTRTLFRNPATRPLVRTVPNIVRRAAAQMVRGVSRGQPITPQSAVRAIAQQAQRVIQDPRLAVRAFRRGQRMDRQFHNRVGGGSPSGGCSCRRGGGAAARPAPRPVVRRCAACGR